MRRYDSYKDSGQQWLGKIPSHWNMKRLRLLLIENTCNDFNEHTNILLQFKYGEIVRKPNQYESIEEATAIGNYIKVAPQDIMINGLNLNYDFISQRVAQVKEAGIITAAYISLRPTVLADSKYYTYLLKSMDAKKMFHGMGRGIRLTLSYNELKNHFIPYPPKNEQNIIVAYLDKTTSEIDKAIAQQQRMIDLLNERKQIVIQQAVTKGLNPNIKMKNSGVEWIGQVPEHWDIKCLKYTCKINGRVGYRGYTANDLVQEGEGAYTIGGKHITSCKLDLNDADFISWKKYYESPEIMVKRGDIVMAQRGSLGKAALIEEEISEATINPSLVLLNKISINAKFLHHYLISNATLTNIQLLNTATAIPMISQNQISNMKIPVPPLSEQQQIVDHIEQQIGCINKAIAKQQQTIDLLKERKQIIINEAVTGKIKVI